MGFRYKTLHSNKKTMKIPLLLCVFAYVGVLARTLFIAGQSAKRAWDKAPYSWNMVNLFLFGCHVTERTYASTDCTSRVGETIKRKGGVSQACLGKSTSFILDIHNMVN